MGFFKKIFGGNADQSAQPTPVQPTQPAAPIDWRSSPAHLTLLSEFRSSGNPQRFAEGYQLERWQPALREHPTLVIDRWVQEGLLVRPPLDQLLDDLTGAELKELAKERDLKVSGKKADLIARLIEADRPGMAALVAANPDLTLSAYAQSQVQPFLEYEAQRRASAEASCWAVLNSNHLDQAGQIATAFDQVGVFPVTHITTETPLFLRVIMTAPFSYLDHLPGDQQRAIRLATAMRLMWSGEASRWLPDGMLVDGRFTAAQLTQLLLNYAQHIAMMQRYEATGIKKVVVVAGPRVCPSCQKLAKVYPFAKVPALPAKDCQNPLSCDIYIMEHYDD